MKIAVMGAARGVGFELVKLPLAAGHGGFPGDRIANPLLLGPVSEDKNRQEALVKASGATWTIVRPGFMTNGPRTGTYRVIDDLTNVTAGRSPAPASPTSCSGRSANQPTSAGRRCCALPDLRRRRSVHVPCGGDAP